MTMYNSEPPSNPYQAWQHWALRMEQRLQEQQQTIEKLEQELQLLKQQLTSQEQQSTIYHVEKIEYHFDQLKVDTLEGSLQIGLSTSNPEQLPMMIEDFAMQQQNANAPPIQYKKNGQKSSSNAPYGKAAPYASPYVAKPNSNIMNRPQEGAAGMTQPAQHASPATENLEQAVQDQSTKQSHPSTNAPNATVQANYNVMLHQQQIETCIEHVRSSLEQRFTPYIDRQSSLMQVEMTEDHKKLIVDDIDRQLPARVHYYYEERMKKNTAAEELIHQVCHLTINDIESAIDHYLYGLSQQDKENK